MKKHCFSDLAKVPWFLLLFVCSNLFAQTTITLPTACSDCKSSSNGTAVVSSYGGVGCTQGSSGTLNGTYTVGQALTTANTMTLYANVTQVGSWNITTTANNGVTFSGSGTFTATGCQLITLNGSGTPITEGPLVAVTNTTPQGTATTAVQPVKNPSTGGTGVASSFGAPNCLANVINGSLTKGVAVSGVTMSLYANVTTLGTYNITAGPTNGVTFAGSGTFTALGCQLVTLTATGTPTTAGTNAFVTNTTPSASVSATTVAPVSTTNPIGAGSFSGKTCFDVAISNDNANGCGALSGRTAQKSDFSLAATNTQTYTFTPSGTVSNVRFVYVNTNGNAITAIAGGNAGNNISSAVTATVTYANTLNTAATSLTSSNPITSDIYVVYNDAANNTGSDVQLKLTANIKDCACCGAFVAAGVFKQFLCHNLGANTSLDPNDMSQTNAWGLNGAYIAWGRRGPTGDSRVTWVTAPNDGLGGFVAAPTGSTAGTANSGNAGLDLVNNWAPNGSWNLYAKTPLDPCPSGWRVPNAAEWTGVINNNTLTKSSPWLGGSVTNYNAGVYVGPNSSTKSLTLPAAGSYQPGSANRGRVGYYWSSNETTAASTINSEYFYFDFQFQPLSNGVTSGNRSVAMSIRCIQE